MQRPSVSIRNMDEAAAANLEDRGDPNCFRAVTFGGQDDDGEEFEDFLVVPESVTAFDLITGQGEPIALCFSLDDAERVAAALNRASAA